MNCELHNEDAELCESHIIPKFVYNWMKETGTGRFRNSNNFNLPVQDGIKKDMLCVNCETRFSIQEKWFQKNVFIPYIKNTGIVINNCEELKYFVISVLWRVLRFYQNEGEVYNFQRELIEAELEWRKYLLLGESLNTYNNIHFILVDSSYWVEQKSDFYFSRAVDIDIAESNEISFVYAKFARFILIAEIKGIAIDCFQNTNIATAHSFQSDNQQINDIQIIDFMREKVTRIKNFEELSLKQQEKNTKYYSTKIKKMENSDYMQILKKYL